MFKRLAPFPALLSSLHLTVTVLTALILLTIPATLIPQGGAPLFYHTRYPGPAGYLIVALGYHRFFTSPLFLVPLGIFWLNLFSCTLKRFRRQLRLKFRGRYGPDILHTGLLLLILAAAVSAGTRQEGFLFLKEGEAMRLPDGSYLILEEFIYETYPDGRPKHWESRGILSLEPAAREGTPFRIAVNNPLRTGKLVFYQSSYRSTDRPGEYESGLTVASDPGKPFVLLSFLLIFSGLTLTFLQKRRPS